MIGTVSICAHCGRPIVSDILWAGGAVYHRECTQPPGPRSNVFQPLPLTADEVRQIVREELLKAFPPVGTPGVRVVDGEVFSRQTPMGGEDES